MEIQAGSGGVAEAFFGRICQLYDTVFSKPPFVWIPEESRSHEELLRRLIADSSFSAVVIHEGSELIGFAYGATLGPDTHWWNGLPPDKDAEFYSERPGRTFALIDLAVHPAHRRRGFGRLLVTELLNHRSEERATLSVQPTAIGAQHFYGHLGWTHIGVKEAAPGSVSPRWDIFVKDNQSNPTGAE
jgi:ribosomal protein S18 acetylase RimI-like enzyme